jgi:hypothetical protein
MELFDTLASVGLTTRVLQITIIAAIAVVVAGMFWQYIVIGAGILFCVVVFAMSPTKVTEVAKVEQVIVVPEVTTPPVDEVSIESKVDSDERMFLEDCGLHSGYTPSQCKALWESDKAEIEKSNWKYKNKKVFGMKKVKYGT